MFGIISKLHDSISYFYYSKDSIHVHCEPSLAFGLKQTTTTTNHKKPNEARLVQTRSAWRVLHGIIIRTRVCLSLGSAGESAHPSRSGGEYLTPHPHPHQCNLGTCPLPFCEFCPGAYLTWGHLDQVHTACEGTGSRKGSGRKRAGAWHYSSLGPFTLTAPPPGSCGHSCVCRTVSVRTQVT